MNQNFYIINSFSTWKFLDVPDAAEWVTLTNHPTPTVTRIQQALANMDVRGKKSLTILVLGKIENLIFKFSK